ncbi:hypothetical protein BGZ75_004383 [Mortierella antarctica]|nr:hypothetical protein BGZ75_004383 [Mortierella antarctica]
MDRSVMLSSSSFHYTPEVVDLEAMNITEMFPEASSFSFDMSSSYNHSYSDSISGVPLAQQALWDDGQLSMSATVNSSRVFAHSSALSSLNNSANNSINHGHLSSRHLLVPPSHHGHHLNPHHHHHLHPQQQQYHYQGSPLKGDDGHLGHEQEQDQSHYDEYDESSLQHGWIDETRDQNGILLLNDKEHQDEQHLMFLQDIGATANLSRGDSISLFAKLADESDLSCDLFKEEIDADETRDQSKLQFEYGSSKPGLRVNTGDGNAIFDQEFLASLRTPLFPQPPPPPLESATKQSFFEGLHTISAQDTEDDNVDIPHKSSQHSRAEGSRECQGKNDAYQQALKSFFDSLKIADPIKTPHKFAPQPLPILWNEPKIRSKALPSFDLADYTTLAQSTTTTLAARTIPKSTSPNPSAHATSATVAAMTLQDKLGSLSSSPTNTHSIHTSARSSPMSSLSTTPPTGIKTGVPTILSTLSTPRAPTGRVSPSDSDYRPVDNGSESCQSKMDLSPTSSRERVKRRPTVSNPHLAFDPTIPPSERAAEDMRAESRSAKGTMERRSTPQQSLRARAYSNEQDDNDPETVMDPRPNPTLGERQGSVSGLPSSTMPSGLKGPVIRKRRSLHQEMFQQNQAAGVERNPGMDQQDEPPEGKEEVDQQPSTGRKGPRPLSVNILPESLTSLNNHALHQESANIERARRLSEEEGAPASRIPGTLSLGRAAGARYGRSGSNASGGSAASQMSPTTPTIANPYGTLTGRTPVRQSSQRLSMSGLSGMYTRPQSQQQQHHADEAPSPSKMQTPSSVRSRNGSRTSPPPTLQGLRRPGHATTAYESQFQKESPQPSPATEYNDEYHNQGGDQYQLQSPSRLSYSRRQQDAMDRAAAEPEWNDNDYEETSPRRTLTLPQQVKTRDTGLTRRRSSAEQQREQHQLQRLRIQQQAREEVYGRGYGNGYADVDQDPMLMDDYSGQSTQRFNQPFEQQQQQHQKRNSLHSPPRDYMSATTSPVTPTSATARGLAAAAALRSSPTRSPVTQQSSSRYSDHHRRQSRDGHTLMAAPRISPPLTAAPTGHARMSSGGHYAHGSGIGLTPRRSVSNVGGGSLGISATSRRLSTATNVGVSSPTSSGYESGLASSSSSSIYNHGRGSSNTGGGHSALHGRSVSSGSGYGAVNSTTTSPRSSMYSASSANEGGFVRSATSIMTTDGGSSNLHPPLRRATSTMIATPTSRRTSGTYAAAGHSSASTTTPGYRASTLGHSASTASSEYARVFVPPRAAAATGGGHGYGGNNSSSRNSHMEDYHPQDTFNNYRPDVPARQSSLSHGVGSRSSLATPRSSSSGNNAFLGAPLSSSTSSSSSHLRRASSMSVTGNVNGVGGGGGLGSASLGRSAGSGVLSRQQSSSIGQPPQRYQRTSTYGYRS